jgi:peptidoglycan/LPS O-acetylase OafA/YrhL
LAQPMRPILRPVMPELHSLRGLACLAVLFFHGFWCYLPRGPLHALTAGGHYGVNLFFVLSGFLITGILLDSKQRQDYFVRFYKRRVLRILPAYYMMIALLAMYGLSPRFLGLSLLHVANMAPAFGVALAYGPFWSLAVEEQFYFLWPLIVRRSSTRLLVVVLFGIIVNNLRLAFMANPEPWIEFRLWYSSHGLALGALLAIFLRSSMNSRRNVVGLAAAAAMTGIGLIALQSAVWQTLGWELVFSAVLLSALLLGASRFEAWTRPRLLLFIGEISYGLYLVHVFVFSLYRRVVFVPNDTVHVLVQFFVCSAVSILLATASRFTVESWFLGLKDKPLSIPRKQVISEELATAR